MNPVNRRPQAAVHLPGWLVQVVPDGSQMPQQWRGQCRQFSCACNRLPQTDPPHPFRQSFTLAAVQKPRVLLNANPYREPLLAFHRYHSPKQIPHTRSLKTMPKQQKTALNMPRFIRCQTLTLLEKLNYLDAYEQADICESLLDHAD